MRREQPRAAAHKSEGVFGFTRPTRAVSSSPRFAKCTSLVPAPGVRGGLAPRRLAHVWARYTSCNVVNLDPYFFVPNFAIFSHVESHIGGTTPLRRLAGEPHNTASPVGGVY